MRAGEGGRHAWPNLCPSIFAAMWWNAIDQGLSCRQAAERFGVNASSAIRWLDRLKQQATSRRRAAIASRAV